MLNDEAISFAVFSNLHDLTLPAAPAIFKIPVLFFILKIASNPASHMLTLASRQKLDEGVGMAPISIVWREAGSFTFAKLEQLNKVLNLTVITLGGNAKLVRSKHISNAWQPMSFNSVSFSKSTLTRAHRANAVPQMDSNFLSSWKFTEETATRLPKAALPIVLMRNEENIYIISAGLKIITRARNRNVRTDYKKTPLSAVMRITMSF